MNKIIIEDAKVIANASIDWGKLRNKTVFIAGANGYVPQFFVHGLLMRNDVYGDDIKVVAMCRSRERAMQRFAEYEVREDFELYLGDVRDPIVYEKHIDYIIHAASPANMKIRYKNLSEVFDSNVLGCRNLLELSLEKGAQFLFVSSVDVYGKTDGVSRLQETYSGSLDPLNPRNVYSCAKRAAETLCICYENQGISCKIVRPFQILGSGIALDDGRLHADFISQIKNGDKIVLKGDGTPRRSFMYITDAIIGMLVVMLKGNSGEAYNVVSEQGEASVLELAQVMASNVKGRTINIEYNMETRTSDPAVANVISVVVGDSTKLRRLGWEAKVSLKDACKRMMEYYGV